MQHAGRIRVALGTLLIILALTALFAFSFWQKLLFGLSPDGQIEPISWIMLRITLLSLGLPGIVLVAWRPLRQIAARGHAWLLGMSDPRFVRTALLVALVIRVGFVIIAPLRMYVDWPDYDELGRHLAETGEFAEETHRTMYRPPGYPFFLSLIYRAFGHEPQIAVAANILLSLGIMFLAYRLARSIWNEPVARWATVILVFFPSQILFLNFTCTEPLFTFLFLLGLLLFSAKPPRLGLLLLTSLASGIALGLATLVRPLTLTFPLVFLPFWLGSGRRRVFGSAIALVCGLALVVTPWMVRNYNLSGRATIATNGGMNFYLGNNPQATFRWSNPDPELFARRSPADEARADRQGYKRGFAYLRQEPLTFIKRGALKAVFLMVSDTEGWGYELARTANQGRFGVHGWLGVIIQSYYFAFLLLVICGVWIYLRQPRPRAGGGYLFLLTILYWIAVHAVFFGDGRFHYPIVSLMTAFAAVAVVEMGRQEGITSSPAGCAPGLPRAESRGSSQ